MVRVVSQTEWSVSSPCLIESFHPVGISYFCSMWMVSIESVEPAEAAAVITEDIPLLELGVTVKHDEYVNARRA